MRGIRKAFSGVEVLKGVDFETRAGEVHALVGENGAGKSTLMNLLAGVHQPNTGAIDFDGHQNVSLPNEKAAQQLGIAIVFQERSLFPTLTVAENVFAGRQPINRWGRIDWSGLNEQTRALLAEVQLNVSPTAQLDGLSPAQQQMVEIAKALSLRAKLIIFDEPTAALTEQETRALFEVIQRLRQRGAGIVYISHRLEELFQIADRVTVLKDGEGQGTMPVAETTTDELIRRMVGRDVERPRTEIVTETNPILLEVRGLSDPVAGAPSARSSAVPLLRDISFSVRAGEIVGFAGLAGAGRTELALSIFGVRPRGAGEIRVAGKHVRIGSPCDAIAAGIGYAYEDRKDGGLFLDMTIARNVAAARLDHFGSWWFSDSKQQSVAEEFCGRLRIASRDVNQEVLTLSGGNQQKVALAKWLLVNPRVLIVDEPTRGVDVGAKAEVHALLYEFSRRGAAVIVISSDLPEVLAVSDRILVMRQGRIAGELPRKSASEEAVMRLAATATA